MAGRSARSCDLTTRARVVVALLFAGAALAAPGIARAADDAAEPSTFDKLVDDFNSGADLVKNVPSIAVFEAMWSININVGTMLATRTWDSFRGPLAHELTRILYGTTWTAMLGTESLVAALATGGRFGWASGARYWTTWLVGADVPAGCAKLGAAGGCGVGVGSFGGLAFRLQNTHIWVEASGGWIEQRVSTDADKTIAESTWLMTPAHVYWEGRRDVGPISLRAEAGPSLDFGMHNAHMHARAGRGSLTKVGSWTELYPLDGGLGGGGRLLGQIGWRRIASLEGELRMVPLVLGLAQESPDPELGALARPRSAGIPIYRQIGLGGSMFVRAIPVRLGLHFWAAEMSTRRVTEIGHRAVELKFEFPLRGDL